MLEQSAVVDYQLCCCSPDGAAAKAGVCCGDRIIKVTALSCVSVVIV